jgi:hypothetical protein
MFVPDDSGPISKYGVLIIGQILGAIGQPFLLNGTIRLSHDAQIST